MAPTSTGPALLLAGDDLLARLADDPWSLDRGERRCLRAAGDAAQALWLPRLRRLVEPPLPAGDFPAFLLELPPFWRLKQAVGTARTVADLDVGTADELQRFVDRYADYLEGA